MRPWRLGYATFAALGSSTVQSIPRFSDSWLDPVETPSRRSNPLVRRERRADGVEDFSSRAQRLTRPMRNLPYNPWGPRYFTENQTKEAEGPFKGPRKVQKNYPTLKWSSHKVPTGKFPGLESPESSSPPQLKPRQKAATRGFSGDQINALIGILTNN